MEGVIGYLFPILLMPTYELKGQRHSQTYTTYLLSVKNRAEFLTSNGKLVLVHLTKEFYFARHGFHKRHVMSRASPHFSTKFFREMLLKH